MRYVVYMVNGEYKWYNNNSFNVLTSSYKQVLLSFCYSNPNDFLDTYPLGENNFTIRL